MKTRAGCTHRPERKVTSAQKRLCNGFKIIENRLRRGALGVFFAARALAQRARSTHFTQAAEISALAHRAGLGEVHAWATGEAMRLTPNGLARMLRTEATIRELNAGGGALRARDPQEALTLLHTMAARHSEPPSPSPSPANANASAPSRPSDAAHPVTTSPASNTTSGSAAATLPWTAERIDASIEQLARQRGITAPSLIKVMKSLLLNPAMTVEQRAASVGGTRGGVQTNINALRKSIGNETDSVRVRLAESVGMPFSALVARIDISSDPTMARRVIETIDPSHREGVAKLLLSVQPGSDRDVMIYPVLDAIFRGGDPFASAALLAKDVGQPPAKLHNAIYFLQQTFVGDRITMLRKMGFDHEQILSMNPVGAELRRRFDPALGSYSATEQTARRAKHLPCTREEAAERLLRAGVERSAPSVQPLTYRSWVTIGMVSDRPWSMPADITKAFETIKPNAFRQAGESQLTRAFQVAQVLLNRDIPRGSRSDLMDRSYRQEINLLLLQTFGLGATRIGSSRLESIPTDFHVSDWPVSNEAPTPSARSAPRNDQGGEVVTWQELLPLLQRQSSR